MTKTITLSNEEAAIAIADYAFKKGYITESKITAKSIWLDHREETLSFEYEVKKQDAKKVAE